MEIAARYFGLPSPACVPLVGLPIGGTRLQVDSHGFWLCSAPLPGDGFRTQHGMLKWMLYEDIRKAVGRVSCEVYGLFAPLLPQRARNEMDSQPARRRQGLVPDFLAHLRAQPDGPLRDLLLDVKTLHYGTSTYPHSEERCRAVTRRAAAVNAEYLNKARSLDREFLHVHTGMTGPVERKLRSFGQVRGLVFGAWSEASADVNWLMHQIADCGSMHSRQLGTHQDADVVRASMLANMQRRWGIMAARANAQLLLDRLAFVGRGAGAAISRRAISWASHAARSRSLQW